MSNRIEELFLELAPTGRGYDGSSKRPIEQAPQSRANKDSRRLASAIAGGQGRRVTGLNMAKSFPLPLVRANSKNTFGELEDSEPGFWGVHGLGRLWNNVPKVENTHFCSFSSYT